MTKQEAIKLARELRRNQTPAEELFWDKVRNRRYRGLKFTRQFPIEFAHGSFYIADFHCHEKKLIIELDGFIHNEHKDYDQARDRILSAMGFIILRFPNHLILENWTKVDSSIKSVLLSPNPSLKREGN